MVVGVLAVGLGAVGIFVPLLPTTPLLLLAAACFVRSSDRLYGWLLHHRWFGTYIRNYREHRAVPLRIKITSLALLWSTMGFSALHVVESTWLRVLLFLIATGVTIHIVRLKTLSQ
ncbi:MAG: YbaN family protein [Anaerolineae bacterium]